MTLLSTRIHCHWRKYRIRDNIVPSPSQGSIRASHHVVGAAIHGERALCTKLDNPIQCTNRYKQSVKYCNDPKWEQQHRPFSHQTEVTSMSPQEMASLQTALLREASYLTRALYRKCLKSIKLLAEGNQRDEADFVARETQERNQFSDDGNGTGSGVNLERISMAPPVNRRNELSSRENYYRQFSRENFNGHWGLLGAHGFHIGDEGNMSHGMGGGSSMSGGGTSQQWNQYQGGHHHLGGQMSAQISSGGENSISDQRDGSSKGDDFADHYTWREDQIEQFVYLIRSGEEKRQWILNDYEFDDPFCSPKDGSDGWPQVLENRLNIFEARSGSLIKEMYRQKGWMHSSDNKNHDNEDDYFSDDSDSDDDL